MEEQEEPTHLMEEQREPTQLMEEHGEPAHLMEDKAAEECCWRSEGVWNEKAEV